MGDRDRLDPPIECGSTRELFTELVGEAVAEVRADLSPLASAYLVELLDQALRSDPAAGDQTLAEALLSAQLERGSLRAVRLRELGDRALFAAGFFSAHLRRRVVGERYYCEVGAAAYGGLASLLSRSGDGASLFGELAGKFPVFMAVLAEVGERSRQATDEDLLALWDRFARDGSRIDRARLVRRGVSLPEGAGRGRLQ